MKRERNEMLAQAMEDDARDESVWEDDPVPAAAEKARLGTQVSLRLDPDVAEILRRIARQKRVGYTSLIREWVVERLREEEHAAERVLLPQASWSRTIFFHRSAVLANRVSSQRICECFSGTQNSRVSELITWGET